MPFQPQPDAIDTFYKRAVTKTDGKVSVTAAVPSPEETQDYFGLDLYARGIQPVWLKVENATADRIRFAPTGVDRQYFSALEVSYVHRNRRSDVARKEMDRFFHASTMPRHIAPGESRSGFVFTHSSPGTKSFTVDLFAATEGSYEFTYFIPVPGFIPDHAEIHVEELFPAERLADQSRDELRASIGMLPCCADTSDTPGAGRPVNVVLIGDDQDALHALMRAGWYEVSRPATPEQISRAPHLDGRIPDAVFQKRRQGKVERNELLVWRSPLSLEGVPVWWAQVNHFLTGFLGQAVYDPDVDDATAYLLQDLWYSQGLKGFGWVKGSGKQKDGTGFNLFNEDYFTSGFRVVLLLSATPVSLLETEWFAWDRIGKQ